MWTPGPLSSIWRNTGSLVCTRRKSSDSCCWRSVSSSGVWSLEEPHVRSVGRESPLALSSPIAGTLPGWGWENLRSPKCPALSECNLESCRRYSRRWTWAEIRDYQRLLEIIPARIRVCSIPRIGWRSLKKLTEGILQWMFCTLRSDTRRHGKTTDRLSHFSEKFFFWLIS